MAITVWPYKDEEDHAARPDVGYGDVVVSPPLAPFSPSLSRSLGRGQIRVNSHHDPWRMILVWRRRTPSGKWRSRDIDIRDSKLRGDVETGRRVAIISKKIPIISDLHIVSKNFKNENRPLTNRIRNKS